MSPISLRGNLSILVLLFLIILCAKVVTAANKYDTAYTHYNQNRNSVSSTMVSSNQTSLLVSRKIRAEDDSQVIDRNILIIIVLNYLRIIFSTYFSRN